MGLYDKFATSKELETKGITLDLGILRVRLARAGGSNQRYNGIMERIQKQHKRAIENDLLSNEKGRDLLYEAYAEAVVMSWETRITDEGVEPAEYKEGIEQPDGSIAPFTKENVKETFKRLPDLFREIKDTAESMQFYRASLVEDSVKN